MPIFLWSGVGGGGGGATCIMGDVRTANCVFIAM